MCVLYDSGMRVDELVSMDVRNVCPDYDNVKLRIHGKGNKERCVINKGLLYVTIVRPDERNRKQEEQCDSGRRAIMAR